MGRLFAERYASDEGNRLTSDDVVAVLTSGRPASTHLVMCGPASLVSDLRTRLRARGITRAHVEAFDIRGAFGPDLSKPLETLVENARRGRSSRP